jgi:uncharacterized protein
MRLRQWFRLLEPRVLGMMNSPLFVRIKPWVDQHDVFSFRREPLARGLAFGMFCSLIPGPLQMLASLLACALFRANIIAAFAATIVSNPITIVPLYVAAFHIGAALLPGQADLAPISSVTSFSFGSTDWFMALSTWVQSLGWPLVLGLPILGVLMALCAYALVQILWLWPIWMRFRRMQRKR